MNTNPYSFQRAGSGVLALPAWTRAFFWNWRTLLCSLLLLTAPALRAADHRTAPGASTSAVAPSLFHYLAGTPWRATDPLTVTSTFTYISCFGGSDGTVSVTIAGGTAPYTLSWTVDTSPGNHTQTVAAAGTVLITGLPLGTYYFTVTDAAGNTGTCSDYVSQPVAYRTTFTTVGVGCSGSVTGSITMSVGGATPPFTYLWSNGATTRNLTGLTAGTYTVTITDAHGCMTTASATVPAATTITALASKTDVACGGGSTGSITLAVSGGTAPYAYLWSNGATTQNLSGIPAGTYSVTVTDAGGCTGTGTATLLAPAVLRANVAVTRPSCFGGATGGAAAAPSGGTAPYSYLWSNGATTAALNNVAGGTYSVIITDAHGCTATGTANITESTQLTATATKTDVACHGGGTGSIRLALGGGTAPFTFLWSNGATTQDLSGLAAGTYTVTVTDANGCTATAGATIGQPAALQAHAVPTPAACAGSPTGAIALTVSGGTAPFSFLWINGATTQNLTNVHIGTYSVIVTDAHGCTATASATVGQPDVLTAISTATDVSCYNATNGSVTLSVDGGTAPYSYLWSNGATTQSLSGLAIGTYNVTVTDAHGCTAACGATVGRPALLLASASAAPAACAGSPTGAIALTVSGGTAPFGYAWSNGATTQNLSGLSAGTYSVTVTDAHGCTATASATVGGPALLHATARPMDASCFDAANGSVDLSVSGGTAPYSYQWSNGATTQDLVALGAGTYAVTVTDAHGCTATASATVGQPATLTALASKTDASCTGSLGSIDLAVGGGTAPYSFLWSNGATTQNLSGLGAGTYTVTVTDAHGCTAGCGATISQPVTMHPSVSVTAANCCTSNSGSIDLTVSGGTPPFSYLWSNGATTQDLTNVPAGAYSVTITDASRCTATASATITQPTALHASTSSTNAACAGSDGTATVVASGGTAPYSYRWSPGGQITATATGLASGSYTVTITDARGCTLTASAAVLAASCRAQHCTLTQGGYGNSNGVICKEPSKRRLELIADMFMSADLVLGAPGRSLTYSYAGGSSAAAALARQTTAQCIIDKMPAGGPAAAFPGTLGNASGCASSFPTNFLKNGRFGNVLVGQTLALALNLRLDNTLAGVPLSATMSSYATLNCSSPDPRDLTGISRSTPAAVLGNLSYLGGTPTVGGLLVLANKALGGVAYANGGGNPNASDIAGAVGAMNELFDDCRMFGANTTVRALAAAPATSLKSQPASGDNSLAAYPNPFTTSTTLTFALPQAAKYSLVVYDLKGSEVARVSSGQAEAGLRYHFTVGTGLQEGVYVARLLTANGTQTIRLNVLH